jgi:ATP-dependent DNA helicase RecG
VVERSITYLNNIKLDSLKGFGEKRYSSLKKSNLSSVADLLRFFPKKHIDRSKIKKIVEIDESDIDKEVTMIGSILKVSVFTTRSRLRITTLSISDSSGNVKAKWFGPQYIESRFKEGDDVALSGKPDIKKTGSIEFKNPTIEKFADIEELNETGSLIPIYPKVDGISSAVIRKALKEVLQIIDSPKDEFLPGIKDVLPQKILEKYSKISRSESFKSIHFPKNLKEYNLAKERLALDEFIYLRSIFENLKSEFKNKNKGPIYDFDDTEINNFISELPFKLTQSQISSYKEILDDLTNTFPMKRLLQGDVGSGKTVVAAIAVYAVVKSGFQVAFMAPTEVLAEQHLKSISEFLKYSKIDIFFLSSSVKDRETVMESISTGKPGLYIGTHALIQEKVLFSNLGLVIIDEQQRFGVDQRKKLIAESNIVPDQLVMTATPIPRTTALSIYGDLDISSINELPPGRKEIVSYLFTGLKGDNNLVFDKCKEHLNQNSQIFVVCPYIDESENSDIQAAEIVYKEYKEKFEDKNVAILHGKMPYEEKERIMSDMTEYRIDILVSTVVIEVGIDIPNASLMVIESAERFGLNQLHQLRGRVGRGEKQSECIFHITKKKSLSTISEDGKKRLEAIVELSDGFKLSEIDLEIRGEGKVTGKNQSGRSDLKIADLRYDYELLLESKSIYENIKGTDDSIEIFQEAKLLFPNYFAAEGTT